MALLFYVGPPIVSITIVYVSLEPLSWCCPVVILLLFCCLIDRSLLVCHVAQGLNLNVAGVCCTFLSASLTDRFIL